MAEEEVSVIPSPAETNKRKLEELDPETLDPETLDPETLDPVVATAGSNGMPEGAVLDDDVVESDSKRPRLGESTGLETQENGSQDEKPEEQLDDGNQKETEEPNEVNQETRNGSLSVEETKEPIETEGTKEPTQTEGTQEPPQTEGTQEPSQTDGTQEPARTKENEVKTVDTQENFAVDLKSEDHQLASIEDSNGFQVAVQGETNETYDVIPQTEANEGVSITRKIDVAGSKVGVLIGKGGETIKYMQYNSGAKIQILRDAEADPDSSTRPVEMTGSLASIEKAEKLIQAVISEAEAGGSPSLIARGHAATQASGVPEQIEMPVPFDKVGLVIGRRGETIKSMQMRSGARIQLIQEHEGAGTMEKIIRVSGNTMQIKMATEMIKDVMNQISRPFSMSGGFNQPHYRPRGPTGPPHWGSRGPHGGQPMPYDYHHPGPYPPQSYHPPPYGGYPPQNMPPRGGYGPGWDQRPPHRGGYDYYGRQGNQNSVPLPTPSRHAPGPLPPPAMGAPPPSQVNYNYGQSHSSDYGHGAPYNQAPQQNYGQIYEQQPKYDNPPPMHQTYGGGSQPGYPQAGTQQGYNQPQQHVKPYGMQGPSPQAYGAAPRAATPTDAPYPGMAPSAQSYGPNTAAQQEQYSYGSSGPMQQSYPSYGSGATSGGYNQQAAATTAPTYQQQGVQPSYGQPATSGGHGSYLPSQQTHAEQPAQPNGSYGYQGAQDSNYGGGSGSSYAAAPINQQGYPQATQAQPGYDQAATQSAAGYAAAPGNVPAESPALQPGYPLYDANQVYAAPL